MAGTDRSKAAAPGGPAIVLIEPQLGENIGAAARAMWNFGLRRMRLVAPRDGWPNPAAVAMASGAGGLLDEAQLFATTAGAVGDNGTIYATTGALVPDAAGVIALGKEFGDDNGSVHELNIALLAAAEITAGCNPPDNDSFCPDGETTRGEMAAFLVRALDLPASDEDVFTDDEGSIFEGNINALAAAGVTKGCNPPENDEFCPDRSVSRAEMAAFLVRGLSLAASADDAFTDDDGSIFESDINSLAAAGITKGCNPPVNDNYCPDGATTRGEMASFLVRALKLGS
ncbi:MAG: S-layer homology domain-containing protein [Candidatus Limnocylindria bacterium]